MLNPVRLLFCMSAGVKGKKKPCGSGTKTQAWKGVSGSKRMHRAGRGYRGDSPGTVN